MITMTDILSFWLHGPDRPIMCRMLDGRIGFLEKPPGDLGKVRGEPLLGFRLPGERLLRWLAPEQLQQTYERGEIILAEITPSRGYTVR